MNGQSADVTIGKWDRPIAEHAALVVRDKTMRLLGLRRTVEVDIPDPTDKKDVQAKCFAKAKEIVADELPAKWSLTSDGVIQGHCFRSGAWKPCTLAQGDSFESQAFPVKFEGSAYSESIQVGAKALNLDYLVVVQSA
jgi:hypothetical protein